MENYISNKYIQEKCKRLNEYCGYLNEAATQNNEDNLAVLDVPNDLRAVRNYCTVILEEIEEGSKGIGG